MAELGLPLTVRLYKFQVTRSLANLHVLFALMRVAQSLLRNPHIHIEPYVSG
jgi:transcription initiation factor TFIID subunit 6